jgi:uncharacterized protein HemX
MDSNSNETRQEELNATPKLLAEGKSGVDPAQGSTTKASNDGGIRGWLWDHGFQILLTAILGAGGWYFQHEIQTKADENNRNIQSKVEENNRLLETRQALTEEFYKRKLDRYEKTCTEIARLEEALERYDGLEINPEVGAQATDSMNAVDRLSKSDFLYLSAKFKDQLGDLWKIGADRMSGGGDPDLKKKLRAQIKALSDEMNGDLHTPSLRLNLQP